MLKIREGLSFDDVLLVPRYSKINSRSTDVDLSIYIKKLNTKVSHPIIPANMKSLVSEQLALASLAGDGLTILHRFDNIEDQIKKFQYLKSIFPNKLLGVSIGVKKEDCDNAKRFIDVGANIICVDVAHGHSRLCQDMCLFIYRNFPQVFLIAGNVATVDGARDLWDYGADAVKVGIGSGSICSTRIKTGNGVPSITALSEIYQLKKELPYDKELFIIADGGMKDSGDIVKSLCFADFAMVGNIFAGCSESPGNIISIDGVSYKEYSGSSTYRPIHKEGVEALVPSKGKFENILDELLQGIKSGFSYQGARNLKELQENPEFVKITSAGLRESYPHSVKLK